MDCELAVPVVALYPSPCYQTTIHVLACLDMLSQTTSRKGAIKALFTEQKRVINTKSLRREDFMSVNRFQGMNLCSPRKITVVLIIVSLPLNFLYSRSWKFLDV